jgi:hypothetical protein
LARALRSARARTIAERGDEHGQADHALPVEARHDRHVAVGARGGVRHVRDKRVRLQRLLHPRTHTLCKGPLERARPAHKLICIRVTAPAARSGSGSGKRLRSARTSNCTPAPLHPHAAIRDGRETPHRRPAPHERTLHTTAGDVTTCRVASSGTGTAVGGSSTRKATGPASVRSSTVVGLGRAWVSRRCGRPAVTARAVAPQLVAELLKRARCLHQPNTLSARSAVISDEQHKLLRAAYGHTGTTRPAVRDHHPTAAWQVRPPRPAAASLQGLHRRRRRLRVAGRRRLPPCRR